MMGVVGYHRLRGRTEHRWYRGTVVKACPESRGLRAMVVVLGRRHEMVASFSDSGSDDPIVVGREYRRGDRERLRVARHDHVRPRVPVSSRDEVGRGWLVVRSGH